ncbi:MAG TPA: DUF4266 domain-containing protein [Bdellovibrionales bacterium]|nr:DUF4266 domain-containing protein [Bdellovibrionales bacterium]
MRIVLLALILAVSSISCARLGKKVAAYERQTLSQTGMEFIENPVEESSMQHMFNAREGSVGGFGGAGGGCGCN